MGLGVRGPLPKRSEERIRRNKTGEDGLEIQTVAMTGRVVAPKLNLGVTTHPLVQDLWKSLSKSGQTKFWEPSDWEFARVTMYVLNDMLHSSKISAMMMGTIDSMMSKLLLTEADRRRMKIEVEREKTTGKVINAADKFAELFEQQRQV